MEIIKPAVRLKSLYLALAALWLLVACASPFRTESPDAGSLATPDEKTILIPEPERTAIAAASPTQRAVETGSEATAESGTGQDVTQEQSTPAATPVQIRTALEASDPAAFQLASGQVQLVEFFAFW